MSLPLLRDVPALVAELRAHHHQYEHLRNFCVCGERWPCYGELAVRALEVLTGEGRKEAVGP